MRAGACIPTVSPNGATSGLGRPGRRGAPHQCRPSSTVADQRHEPADGIRRFKTTYDREAVVDTARRKSGQWHERAILASTSSQSTPRGPEPRGDLQVLRNSSPLLMRMMTVPPADAGNDPAAAADRDRTRSSPAAQRSRDPPSCARPCAATEPAIDDRSGDEIVEAVRGIDEIARMRRALELRPLHR